FEKETNSQTGITEYRHFISADGRAVAIQTRKSNGSQAVSYLLPEHQDSVNVVTDASGAVVERMAYDAWGDRRTASGALAGGADPANAIQPDSTERGFTGHEHL